MNLGANLKRYREAAGLTQQELADRTGGVVRQQIISKLEANNQQSSRYAGALADALGIEVSELLRGGGQSGGRPAVPSDLVYVPEYTVEFAAGDGAIFHEIGDGEMAAYRRTWLHKMRLNPEHLRRFLVRGDSMSPLMYDGDVILVDVSDTTVADGKVYALRYADGLKVKRLSKQLGGALVLQSENPLYPSETVPAADVSEHITIIGRVRERCGTGGIIKKVEN